LWKTVAHGSIKAKLYADFKPVEKFASKFTSKSFQQKVKEIWPFSIVFHGHTIGWVITFWGNIFYNLFTRFEISIKFSLFSYTLLDFYKNMF
jgi:hypothetical protein